MEGGLCFQSSRGKLQKSLASEEIKVIIKELKDSKAPGKNSITAKQVNYAGRNLVKPLSSFKRYEIYTKPATTIKNLCFKRTLDKIIISLLTRFCIFIKYAVKLWRENAKKCWSI